MYYGKYKNIRNSTWHCLVECGVTSLPIKVASIVKYYGGLICKNSEVNLLAPNQSGKTYFISESEWYIVVDDSDSIKRQRHTIMHELGHFLLGHFGDSPISNSYSEIKPKEEIEADSFAVRMLAPACVLWGLDLHSSVEIDKVCNILYAAARNRSDRMKILYKRNKFLTHPLERIVYKQFEDFIKNNR